MSKFITAKLTYTPTHCECCRVVNKDFIIYKNGTKTSRVTLPICGIYPTYLNLKKQRFFCKSCGYSFSAKTSIVQKHLPYIENSLLYPYSNGRIEDINNKIKVLNRVAYGYRNFTNFKNRILLHFKLRQVILNEAFNEDTTQLCAVS